MKKRVEGFGIQSLTTQWREDKLERLCNCQVSLMSLIFMDPRLKYTTLSISLPAMCRTASLISSPAAIFSRYIVTMTFKILVAVTLQFSSHKSPGALKNLGKISLGTCRWITNSTNSSSTANIAGPLTARFFSGTYYRVSISRVTALVSVVVHTCILQGAYSHASFDGLVQGCTDVDNVKKLPFLSFPCPIPALLFFLSFYFCCICFSCLKGRKELQF